MAAAAELCPLGAEASWAVGAELCRQSYRVFWVEHGRECVPSEGWWSAQECAHPSAGEQETEEGGPGKPSVV